MKRSACFAVFAAVLASANAFSAPAATSHLTAAPRSALTILGSSNLASWRCTATTMTAAMDVDAPMTKVNEIIDRIESGDIGVWMSDPKAGRFPQPRFALDVPVTSLRCTGGSPMERDLRRALKADQVPSIRFRLAELRGAVTHDIDANNYRGRISGQLSLAGVVRDIELNVVATRLSRDRFRLIAELPLRMTDFAVKPPTALFGAIKAADALTVRFDLVLTTGDGGPRS